MDTERLRLSVEMPKFPIPPSTSHKNIKRLSITMPALPTTNSQWQGELERIKVLYFKRQFKECSSQSLKLLHESRPTNSIHETYLFFYTALSYEMLAHTLSNLSPQRATLLQNAISYYQKALSTIPSTSAYPVTSNSSINSAASSERTASLGSSPRTLSPSSSISSISSVSSSHNETTPSDKLSPSPLRVRKMVRFASPPTSPKTFTVITPSSNQSNTSDTSAETWLYLRALSRFHDNLSTLSTQINQHISEVREALAKIESEREERKMGIGSRLMELRELGFGEEDLKATERRERIAKGRERGWVRQRFEPGRVQEICQRALEDL